MVDNTLDITPVGQQRQLDAAPIGYPPPALDSPGPVRREPPATRGRLRIYLGAAAGVGKTYAMLNEAWRRRGRGADVVVGYVETHGRSNTAAQLHDLEVLPRKISRADEHTFEEMDVNALLARHPQVALVDEFAHTNAPGSGNPKRWLDIEELLDAGIEVISTLNIQHLESLNDVVKTITGAAQRETVPDAVVRRADQIELVDMTPEALRRRMAHGNIYPADKVDVALGSYFRIGNLGALRELALLWVADRADERLQGYRVLQGVTEPWETKERVVVAVTGAPEGDHLLRRGARMAARSKGELIVVSVRRDDGLTRSKGPLLDQYRGLAEALGGRFVEIAGSDVADTLVSYARTQNATQLVLGASRRSRWAELLEGSVINEVIRKSGPIDVHIISTSEELVGRPTRRRHPSQVSRRRQLIAWLSALGAIPLLALALVPLRGSHLGLSEALLVLLLGVLVVAMTGGLRPALASAVTAFAVADWFYVTPYHSLRINHTGDLVIFIVFIVAATLVSVLTNRLTRRSAEIVRARTEAEVLARLAGTSVLPGSEALPELLDQLQAAFALDAVSILVPDGSQGRTWHLEACVGRVPPLCPEDGELTAELSGGSLLVVRGGALSAEDRSLLQTFAVQLRLAQERIRLQVQAASAAVLAEGNRLRTAILAAVSHDLRTPLASIKAAATSILSPEVQWSEEAVNTFCETIDQEADRLNRLVGNMLDMSRLQTGSLRLRVEPVSLTEITSAALAGLSRDTSNVSVDLHGTGPYARADAALLERTVANLLDNSLNWSPEHDVVRVFAAREGNRVRLYVSDRGPGIPPARRAEVFRPFQRLDDGATSHTNGVGLGLAVARSFVEAMGGFLDVEDTPGGGATLIIDLPASEA
jgi:two-component system sensor histidine kinase KdpD